MMISIRYAKEKTSRAQQAALKNVQQMLVQFLNNQNNNDTIGSNHVEKNPNNEPPKTKKSKGSSTIDADVIKGIQAQNAFLT